MGFLDNVTSAVNRGTAAAGRGADKIKLNARIDAEREQCQRQIAAIDEQATAATGFACAVCGAHMTGADLFCSGCGTPAERARAQTAPVPAAPAGLACVSCGAPLGEGDMFCMACGAKVVSATTADAGIGDAELVENAGIGESELAKVDGNGNVAVTPGGEEASKEGE